MAVLLSAMHHVAGPATENLKFAAEASVIAFAIFFVACIVIGALLVSLVKLSLFLWTGWMERGGR